MVLVYPKIYRQKCRIFESFLFSCSKSDGYFKYFKSQDFKTPLSSYVSTDCRNIELVFQLSENQKVETQEKQS